jgi:hypothetical protein
VGGADATIRIIGFGGEAKVVAVSQFWSVEMVAREAAPSFGDAGLVLVWNGIWFAEDRPICAYGLVAVVVLLATLREEDQVTPCHLRNESYVRMMTGREFRSRSLEIEQGVRFRDLWETLTNAVGYSNFGFALARTVIASVITESKVKNSGAWIRSHLPYPDRIEQEPQNEIMGDDLRIMNRRNETTITELKRKVKNFLKCGDTIILGHILIGR